LLAGLLGLAPKFIPYVFSFVVLGLRWLASVQVRSRAEHVGRTYIYWWLLNLILITCVPFSTVMVGRFANLAPAIWLYAANTGLLAVVAFVIMAVTPQIERDELLHERQVSLWILLGSSLLAVGWSLVNPRQALWAFALNIAAPAASRWLRSRLPGKSR